MVGGVREPTETPGYLPFWDRSVQYKRRCRHRLPSQRLETGLHAAEIGPGGRREPSASVWTQTQRTGARYL